MRGGRNPRSAHAEDLVEARRRQARGPGGAIERLGAQHHGPPDLGRALPYRYARARSENVPVYARAPSPAEQLAAEPDLKLSLIHI